MRLGVATFSKRKRELTGRHVWIRLLVFFGTMLSVNIYFTVMAVKSFSGEDVPRSYRQGLDYNQTLESRASQTAMGWSAHVNTNNDKIIIEVRSANGEPIENLQLSASLHHPATLSNDEKLNFEKLGKGRYAATIFGLKGRWNLKAVAVKDQVDFRFESELWLK